MKRKILTVFVLLLAIVQATFANTKQSTDKVVICGISLGMKPYQVFDILGKPDRKNGDLASEKGGTADFYGSTEKCEVSILAIQTKNGKVNRISLYFYKDKEKFFNYNFPDSNIPMKDNLYDAREVLGNPVKETENFLLFSNGVVYSQKENSSWISTSDFWVNSASVYEDEQNKPNFGLVVSESSFTYNHFPGNPSTLTSCTATGFIKNFRDETLDVKVRVVLRNPKTNNFIHAFEKIIRNVRPNEKTLFSIDDYNIYVPGGKAVYEIELSVE
jgi:hypothetical protein